MCVVLGLGLTYIWLRHKTVGRYVVDILQSVCGFQNCFTYKYTCSIINRLTTDFVRTMTILDKILNVESMQQPVYT